LARLRKMIVEAQARYLAAQAELVEAGLKDADLQHDITRVEEITFYMLRCEMQVLMLGIAEPCQDRQGEKRYLLRRQWSISVLGAV
jgi:hypothetical protein